jgi:molybdopterin molybdotransferase
MFEPARGTSRAGHGELLDWSVARTIAARADRLPAETIPLGMGVGRRLAADVHALIDVPHYASSAMDGWAVAGEPPWTITGWPQSDAARSSAPQRIEPGHAVPIVTGGLVPPGASGILRSEHGVETAAPGHRLLRRNASAAPGEPTPQQHIRAAAEEARAGELIFAAGELLSPAHVAVIAACGHDAVAATRVPRVAIINTGTEVIGAGIPLPGQVRDSFGPQMPALLEMMGATVTSLQHLDDNADEITGALLGLGGAESPDVIITTGGTGFSDADHLHGALQAVGATLLVDGVAVRPGAPSLLALLPGGCRVVGLPGNPLAAMIGMLTLAQPTIDALNGARPRRLATAPLGVSLAGKAGRTSLVPYSLVAGEAQPLGWQGSGMMRGLATADGLLVVPPEGAVAGQPAQVLALPWARD